jgi:hypothetical protein
MKQVETTALPVTHPAYSKGEGDRYVLGYAKTELGARRILNKRGGCVRAMTVHLGHSKGPRVWQPA